MLLLGQIDVAPLRALLAGHGIELALVADGAPIPGSYWGEPEAGLVGACVHARADTPVHSVLHEACHLIVQPPARRARVHTDATDCDGRGRRQLLPADRARRAPAQRRRGPPDGRHGPWGYSFRLGSTRAWFEHDADDARAWLAARGLPHALD